MGNFKEETINFKSLDGIELNGKLTFPTNAEIKGGLLLLHGCPAYMDEYGFYSGTPNEFMPYGGMAEFFSANGYITLRFNYRSQSKEMTQEEMGDLSISGMIADTESAYHILADNLKSNLPIYVVGTSFSGGISIQWINNFERNIKHLFLMCPLLNMRHTLRKANAVVLNGGLEVLSPDIAIGLQQNGHVYSGGRKMNYAFFDELLTMNIQREFSLLKCPNSIFHGTIDPSVRYEDSKEFVEKYSNGKSSLYTYENARHGFGGPKDDNGNSDITIKYRNHQDIFTKMLKIIEV
jgi:alpha-beta hydrolase superfamily lysophospholipase